MKNVKTFFQGKKGKSKRSTKKDTSKETDPLAVSEEEQDDTEVYKIY